MIGFAVFYNPPISTLIIHSTTSIEISIETRRRIYHELYISQAKHTAR